MSRNAVVYRVEHQHTGKGPWTHSWGLFGCHNGHTPGDLPCPQEDGIGYPASFEVCATASVRKLKTWFHDPHLKELHDAGFVVRRYRAPAKAVRRGKHQVLIDSRQWVKVGEKSPLHYVGA